MKWNAQTKGSITVLVFIMVGLIIGLYLVGFRSPVMAFVQEDVFTTDENGDYTIQEGFDSTTLLDKITSSITSLEGLTLMGITVGMALLSIFAPGIGYASGSILSVLIPAFLLFLFANLFFFPVLSDPETYTELPFEIFFLITIIFNVLLLLTVLTFITGRE